MTKTFKRRGTCHNIPSKTNSKKDLIFADNLCVWTNENDRNPVAEAENLTELPLRWWSFLISHLIGFPRDNFSGEHRFNNSGWQKAAKTRTGCEISYSSWKRSSLRACDLQSVSLCWNTVGAIVSPSLSHWAMLEKSFNQIDEDQRSQHYATLNRGRRGECFNDLCHWL